MSQWKYAFGLTKQQVAEAEPPGTERLIEHEENDHVTLIPPPTLNPADPLNWSRWRKYTVLGIMSIYCFTVNLASSGLAPSLGLIMVQLPRPENSPPPEFSKLTHLIAFNVLMIGLGNIIWVPMSNLVGRRPVLIFAMTVTVAATVWCGEAKSFDSLLGARVVQGFGMGPADSIAANVVGEMFFVHERGRAMAVYTIFLSGGSFIGGIAGGYISSDLGYRYIFWISLALLGFILVAQILFVPETSFDRVAQLLQDQITSGDQSTTSYADSEKEKEKSNVNTIEHAPTKSMTPTASRHNNNNSTYTYAQSVGFRLPPNDKTKSVPQLVFQHFLAPWKTLLLPGTWLVCLHYGGLLGGLVTISTVGPQILSGPPYKWGNNAGLLNLGGVVGTMIGGLYTYVVTDMVTRIKAKKDRNGLAEPEERLLTMFPALIISTAGIWTFGFSAGMHNTYTAWVGMVFGLGMVGLGITQIPSVGFNYLIDAYGPLAADCFVMTTIARSAISFAWTFFAGHWVETAGAETPFGVFGALMGLFSLLTLPVWYWGKRMRIATAGLIPREE